ncbi:hypothetical protein POF50_019885 [Streptomyces sp. SL13]|uniref:Secreted protein n=1 Tax=Streptantibioticus silvisoli TaxID=2705255 RepID=A0AA90K9S3_9ACTN|nr:hypothetical protein [Streptantibioticus silvisoli]MDI5971563.1 hypothetical protein [Streptantibioticus silvisoli]
MFTRALLTGAVLAGVAGLTAAPALADDSASPSPSASAAPTEAGTSFRTAAVFQQGQQATADASTGDYLYWAFPADAGQNVTVHASVTFPQAYQRHGTSTWQLDVYDGLRRRQPCTYGTNTRPAPDDTPQIQLTCRLRTVEAYTSAWSNDPLRGAFYVRLTAVDVPSGDLGLPVSTSVTATSVKAGASAAVDGSVTPVVSRYGPDVSPTDGWAGTWWSARWLWTAAGGALAALAAIGGYALTRGHGRFRRVPPGV